VAAIDDMIASLARSRDNAVSDLQRLKERGINIVGAYCLFAPYELIAASGAVPVSLCGTSEEPIAHAEKHLPRNLCPLIKSSYGYAVTGTCPYFFYSDLIVGETTCDGKKKMFEILERIAPVHVMRLPQSNNRPEDIAFWKQEILLLKQRLENVFGVRITDQALSEEIRLRNAQRSLCREIYGLSRRNPPLLSGMELHRVLHGAGFAFDRAHHSAQIRALIDALQEAGQRGENRTPAGRPRILITGCPVGGATEKIIRIIEESGGTIVCYENCGGAKDREYPVDELIDPWDALAQKYVRLACSCMSPNDSRMELLSRLIDGYCVHGVIDVVLQACHTYSIETQRVRELVQQQKGKAYLSIETDYSQADEGQLRTRISAFLEMLH
jgi:benzoyl-CoA reductase/2-hydroxyglutaryl-CoA dehydratase subunit BcrC/BadD/HgdB